MLRLKRSPVDTFLYLLNMKRVKKKRVLKHVGMGVNIYLHICGISKQVTILYTYFRYQVRTNRHQSISITCQTRINTNILILVFVTTYMLLVIVTFALPSLVVASVIGYLSMALTISLFLLIWPSPMLLDACNLIILFLWSGFSYVIEIMSADLKKPHLNRRGRLINEQGIQQELRTQTQRWLS